MGIGLYYQKKKNWNSNTHAGEPLTGKRGKRWYENLQVYWISNDKKRKRIRGGQKGIYKLIGMVVSDGYIQYSWQIEYRSVW